MDPNQNPPQPANIPSLPQQEPVSFSDPQVQPIGSPVSNIEPASSPPPSMHANLSETENATPPVAAQPGLPSQPIPFSPTPQPQPLAQVPNRPQFPPQTAVSSQPYVFDASAITPGSTPPAMAQTAASSTAAPNQAMYPNQQHSYNSAPFGPGASLNKRKKRLLFGGVVIMVLVLGAAFVFAYYLPNQPSNVFKSGLNRSGKALNMLVDAATDKAELEVFKKTEMTAKVDATYQEGSFSGSLTAKFDPTHVTSGLDITAKHTGDINKVFSARLAAQLQNNSQYPDVYFKIGGLRSLGLDALVPSIANYDEKWIAIESSYLKSLGVPPITAEQNEKKQLNAADVTDFSKSLSQVTADYILTSSPDRAVLEQRKFIGKEKIDNLSTYRYEVGINKAHAKEYCQVMVDKIVDSNFYKKLRREASSENTADTKKSLKEDCHRTVDNDIKDSDTFDLWINAKSKVIYKARFSEANKKDAYTEVGQNSSGLDNISVFINWHNGPNKDDGKFTLETNLNTHTTQGVVSFVGKSPTNPYSVKVSLEAKPYKGDIKVSKPVGAIPIAEVLKQFGIDPAVFAQATTTSSNINQRARDTERTTDIKALHGQSEAYYAQYGKYPTLANLNDAAWRNLNMRGLDKEALKDPEGSAFALASRPAAHIYSYAVTASDGKACDNKVMECAHYTLSATLEGGGTFTKTNLN